MQKSKARHSLLRSRRRRQNRFAREVFHWPPSAGSNVVCSAHAQPCFRLIPECFPFANGNRSAGGGVIDAQPSGGRRLLCALHNHARACFHGLADGGIITEDEHSLVCWIVGQAVNDLSVWCSAWAKANADHSTGAMASSRMMAVIVLFPFAKLAPPPLCPERGVRIRDSESPMQCRALIAAFRRSEEMFGVP